jgi:hypothetical protein
MMLSLLWAAVCVGAIVGTLTSSMRPVVAATICTWTAWAVAGVSYWIYLRYGKK